MSHSEKLNRSETDISPRQLAEILSEIQRYHHLDADTTRGKLFEMAVIRQELDYWAQRQPDVTVGWYLNGSLAFWQWQPSERIQLKAVSFGEDDDQALAAYAASMAEELGAMLPRIEVTHVPQLHITTVSPYYLARLDNEKLHESETSIIHNDLSQILTGIPLGSAKPEIDRAHTQYRWQLLDGLFQPPHGHLRRLVFERIHNQLALLQREVDQPQPIDWRLITEEMKRI